MRLEEAKLIGEIIRSLQVESCINLGCGQIMKLLTDKPWVEQYLFEPLRKQDVPVIHVDLFDYPGVNYQIDLTRPVELDILNNEPRPRLFILGNVLEHIQDDKREVMINTLINYMETDDHLIISVPNTYPFHADPIDTGYRPQPAEIMQIGSIEWISGSILVCGNYRTDLSKMGLFKALRKLCKPLWPLQSLTRYRENFERLRFLFKDYKVTVVHGRK